MPVKVFKYYLHFNVLKRSKHERQLYAGRETKDVSKG